MKKKMALWIEYQCAFQVTWDWLLNPPETKGQTEIHFKSQYIMQYIQVRTNLEEALEQLLTGI